MVTDGDGGLDLQLDNGMSPRLRRAVAMVMEQIGCLEDEAIAHMTIRLRGTQLDLDHLAALVVEDALRFKPSS